MVHLFHLYSYCIIIGVLASFGTYCNAVAPINSIDVKVMYHHSGCCVQSIALPLYNLQVVNEAGGPIDIFWINPTGGKLTKQTSQPIRHKKFKLVLLNLSSLHLIRLILYLEYYYEMMLFQLHSYTLHQFLVRYADHHSDLSNPIEATFTKLSEPEEVIVRFVRGNMTVEQLSKTQLGRISTRNVVVYCQSMNRSQSDDVAAVTMDGTLQQQPVKYPMESLVSCLTKNISTILKKLDESTDLLQKSQTAVSNRLRNYLCRDSTVTTSPAIKKYNMYVPALHRFVHINILLHLDNAKIWTIENFISREECEVLRRHAGPLLSRATISAENGTDIISEHRRAQQARYRINNETDPLRYIYFS